jgi:hypothetical protein
LFDALGACCIESSASIGHNCSGSLTTKNTKNAKDAESLDAIGACCIESSAISADLCELCVPSIWFLPGSGNAVFVALVFFVVKK